MVYMNIEGDEIISTSPETLVKLQNGVLNTFPIAGFQDREVRISRRTMLLQMTYKNDEKDLARAQYAC